MKKYKRKFKQKTVGFDEPEYNEIMELKNLMENKFGFSIKRKELLLKLVRQQKKSFLHDLLNNGPAGI